MAGTFADVSKRPTLTLCLPGSPLLYPLLPLQVLLPPICKISIFYFLNRQRKETQRNGLYCATVSEVSMVCFLFSSQRRGAAIWCGKGNWKVLTGRCFRSHTVLTRKRLLFIHLYWQSCFCVLGFAQRVIFSKSHSPPFVMEFHFLVEACHVFVHQRTDSGTLWHHTSQSVCIRAHTHTYV